MNMQTLSSAAASLQSPTISPSAESAVLMTCEDCGLVGGPFPPAEAAHLRAIHDRLHHGILKAA